MDLEKRIAHLEGIIGALVTSDRYTIGRGMQFFDGRNVQLGLSTGTKIGTSATQKLGFYGANPIVQQAAISNPNGGTTQDAQARVAIALLITALRSLGFTA